MTVVTWWTSWPELGRRTGVRDVVACMSNSTLTRPTSRSTSAWSVRRLVRTVGSYTGTASVVGSYTGTRSAVGTWTGTPAGATGSYVSSQR